MSLSNNPPQVEAEWSFWGMLSDAGTVILDATPDVLEFLGKSPAGIAQAANMYMPESILRVGITRKRWIQRKRLSPA
jgi:hypothetical protein